MAIVPMTSIASRILPFAIFGGLIFNIMGLITIGIYCYLALLVFQLITLPVEFDASHRAKIILQQMGIIQPGEEAAGVNHVLNAAAWTYVAAFIATLRQPASGSFRCATAVANDSSCRAARPRRLTDLLSSGAPSRAKRIREAMDQPRTDEDQALVARAQSGEAAAFDELVVKYSPRLYGLIYNMTSNHEDTNDMLRMSSPRLTAQSRDSGKIIVLHLDSHHRGQHDAQFLEKARSPLPPQPRRRRRGHQNDKEFIEVTSTSSPVREADLTELQRRLNEAMMKLSDEHRAVVTMFHIQGMPHAEISKILGVSEGTVRSRLFYANRQLQNYLDEFRKNPVG